MPTHIDQARPKGRNNTPSAPHCIANVHGRLCAPCAPRVRDDAGARLAERAPLRAAGHHLQRHPGGTRRRPQRAYQRGCVHLARHIARRYHHAQRPRQSRSLRGGRRERNKHTVCTANLESATTLHPLALPQIDLSVMDSTSLSPGAAVTGAPAKRRTATVLPPAPPLRELARSPPTHPPPVRKVAQPRFAALSPPPRTRRRGECARASSRIQRHAAAHRAGACACARTAWSRGGVGGALRGGKEREMRTASTLSF